MNNVGETFVEKTKWICRVAAKRRWLALGVAAVLALVAGVGISNVPDRYEATARVYVDTQTVLKPLMAALTFQPDIDQQVRMLARTLISRTNMQRLVDQKDLRLNVSTPAAREATVTRLMDQIKMVPTSSGSLYEISYRGADPDGAKHLVEATVDLFVNSGAGAKKQDSAEAGRFIEEQIGLYETKLVEAENRLKDFKIRTFGVSGISNQDYFTRVSALTEEVSKLRSELGAAEQSRDAYRRELAAEEPQLPAELAPKVGTGETGELEGRVEAQRKLLDDLLRRYTDDHPDVISARRLIAQLEASIVASKEASERRMAKYGKVAKAATSPVYQKLRISLAETEAHVAAVRSQLSSQQARLDQVRSVAGRVPQVEAELAQLNRDYDVIRKNYDLMVARRESASLGVKLDATSQLAEFRVIDPPQVSRSPVFPGRLHLTLATVVGSLVLGFAIAVIAEFVWPTFDNLASLRQAFGRPSLGSVSRFVTADAKRRERADMVRFAAAFGGLMLLQGCWIAWVALRQPFA